MSVESVEIAIKRLSHHVGLELPAYKSHGSSGMDLQAAVDHDLVIQPGERILIPTGIAIGLPSGFEAQIRPRSGLAIHSGIGLLNAP